MENGEQNHQVPFRLYEKAQNDSDVMARCGTCERESVMRTG